MACPDPQFYESVSQGIAIQAIHDLAANMSRRNLLPLGEEVRALTLLVITNAVRQGISNLAEIHIVNGADISGAMLSQPPPNQPPPSPV